MNLATSSPDQFQATIEDLRKEIAALAEELKKTKQVVKETAEVAASKPAGVVVITPGGSS